ncbi:MAG: GAF domain-containing sensor histidine kinase, partial [Gaiellaceae bacterium]
SVMPESEERHRRLETWIARVRLAAVPFALFQVSISHFAHGFRPWAWAVTGVYTVGALALYWAARRRLDEPAREWLGLTALAFDTGILFAYVIAYAYEAGTPTRQLVFLAVVEGAVRYGLPGALATALATAPALVGFELLRGRYNPPHGFRWDYLTFQLGVEAICGLIVGWLVRALGAERSLAVVRAREAEALRDELGHRADLLDAANRCARALSSSLDLEEAFGAFLRELAGLMPFERVAIIAAEGADALTLASAGRGEATVFPTGWREPADGTLLSEVVATGKTVARPDMLPVRYPEDEKLLALGIRSEVAAPVYSGIRPLGMLVVSRLEPEAFTAAVVELVTRLGRLVGSAVQNIRAYDAEHATVEELRRLSALRADFVSLVSHELRSPMAAVIGSARTLQQRWRELSPEQRESFLALIADETSRLATLVGDVLDTSRIEGGSFPYSFRDVDLAELLRDTVATAAVGQDEVPVELHVREPLPHLRADAARLRQVVANLLDNAVKYSPAGSPVEVRALASRDSVVVSVRDRGPGIRREHQQLIFEKFGRVDGTAGKPGTGLGLFIARSIAEAHGGRIEVESAPGRGTTMSLVLPLGPS